MTPAGWYDDGHGAVRWWDGLAWTPHVQRPQPPPAQLAPQVVYVDHGPYRAVTKSRRSTSHGLHLFLTIVTCGAWGIVWLGMTLWHELGPRRREVTRYR